MANHRRSKVMLLETHLDRRLDSERSQIPFMRAYFRTLPSIDLLAKEVHSRADLLKVLTEARHQPSIKVVHLIAHGRHHAGRASLILTHNDPVDLALTKNQRLFRGLKNKVLFFSCCQLGRNATVMQRLLKLSRATAVFSYSDEVTDYQSFLIEALFYHLTHTQLAKPSPMALRAAYQRLRFTLPFLGIDRARQALIEPVLVADIRLSPGEFWNADVVRAL